MESTELIETNESNGTGRGEGSVLAVAKPSWPSRRLRALSRLTPCSLWSYPFGLKVELFVIVEGFVVVFAVGG